MRGGLPGSRRRARERDNEAGERDMRIRDLESELAYQRVESTMLVDAMTSTWAIKKKLIGNA